MKKFLSFVSAAIAVFAVASCQNDGLDTVATGDSAQVTLSLGVNGGIATKSADTAADVLSYAVYDEASNLVAEMVTVENAFKNGAQNVALTLAKGETYTVVFWAQNAACEAYTVVAGEKGMSVEVDYNGLNNDMTRDAFFAAETFTVEGNVAIDVVLRRPFAKINLGVTLEDWAAAQANGVTVTESKVVISNAATTLCLNNGEVSGEATVTWKKTGGEDEDTVMVSPYEEGRYSLTLEGLERHARDVVFDVVLVVGALRAADDLVLQILPYRQFFGGFILDGVRAVADHGALGHNGGNHYGTAFVGATDTHKEFSERPGQHRFGDGDQRGCRVDDHPVHICRPKNHGFGKIVPAGVE